MAVRVAINGFGRIGRLAFRQMFDAEGYEVVAINDLTSPKMLAHLLKYDTAQGSFCGKIGEGKHTVEATEDSIIVDGKEIKIYAVKDAKDAPWGELNVDVVLECTGFYTSKEKSMAHIQAGAKKVVISAPAGNDLKTIVFYVNEKTMTAEDQVISAASCTTNCLAPMADTLNDIDVQLAPRSILSVLDSVDLDLLAIDNDGILGSLDGVLVLADLAAEGALSGIVLQQVSQHLGAGQVVDSDDLVTLSIKHLTESQTANTTKTIDSNSNSHVNSTS